MNILSQQVSTNTETPASPAENVTARAATALTKVAEYGTVYGLVAVIGWIGAMKFTAYEAAGIHPFASNSPLLNWTDTLLTTRAFSDVLGVVEIAIAALIAAYPLSKIASAIGGLLGIGMFLTTLSFIATTPGVWVEGLGFPALSVPGQFLIKDVVLLAASIAVVANSLRAISDRRII